MGAPRAVGGDAGRAPARRGDECASPFRGDEGGMSRYRTVGSCGRSDAASSVPVRAVRCVGRPRCPGPWCAPCLVGTSPPRARARGGHPSPRCWCSRRRRGGESGCRRRGKLELVRGARGSTPSSRLSPQLTPQVVGDAQVRELVARIATSHAELREEVGALTVLALSNEETLRRIGDLVRSLPPP